MRGSGAQTLAPFPSEYLRRPVLHRSRPRVRNDCAPPSSPRFSRSLRETRKHCACSRNFFDLRAPERLGFDHQRPIYARFSLSRIEPVPFRPIVCQKTHSLEHRETKSADLTVSVPPPDWGMAVEVRG